MDPGLAAGDCARRVTPPAAPSKPKSLKSAKSAVYRLPRIQPQITPISQISTVTLTLQLRRASFAAQQTKSSKSAKSAVCGSPRINRRLRRFLPFHFRVLCVSVVNPSPSATFGEAASTFVEFGEKPQVLRALAPKLIQVLPGKSPLPVADCLSGGVHTRFAS